MDNTIILNVLFYSAFGLLILVSGGILYLTTLRWRDRRLQEKDKRSTKKSNNK